MASGFTTDLNVLLAKGEMNGYPKENRTKDGRFTAERKILVPWALRWAAYDAILGHPGQLYPYNITYRALAYECSISPFQGKQSQASTAAPTLASYEFAALTIKYRTPDISDPQPYPADQDATKHANAEKVLSEQYKPWTEALRLPYSLFKWKTSGDALTPEEAPVRQVSRAEWTVTRYNLTSVPVAVQSAPGKVNDAAMTSVLMPTLTFAAKTLLFVSPDIQATVDDEGNKTFQVSYALKYREETWWEFWRAKDGYDSMAYADGSGDVELPPTADLSFIIP